MSCIPAITCEQVSIACETDEGPSSDRTTVGCLPFLLSGRPLAAGGVASCHGRGGGPT